MDKEKFQEDGVLKHWVDIRNLKIVAASYTEGGSVEGLEQKIAEKEAMESEKQLKNIRQ